MIRIRRLSPWYWVILGATLLGLGVFVTNLLYDWAPKWLTLVASLIPIVAAIYIGRMLWLSDHPAISRQRHGVRRHSEVRRWKDQRERS